MKYDLTLIDLPTLMPEDTVLDVRKFLVGKESNTQQGLLISISSPYMLLHDVLNIGQVVLLADTTWYPTEPLHLGIAQHHDCVTGTAKQYVANDYAKRLALGASEISRSYNNSGLLRSEGYHQSSFVGSYASNYVTGASP
ncbi:hypothetical protein F2Q70_00017796 [Brassica cretica]|uniref:Glycoside hydrolase family 38 central domain-containing protein n=1 Tax=Brassica cretica TaxID=69181 RepID=A0A8S9KU48_BRACR|nr:hypothetical protein F2Q70_00017796 [Brassica cretica]KAF2597267.1 hypothetical protein F2Q68_00010738 [Brassica cretica]